VGEDVESVTDEDERERLRHSGRAAESSAVRDDAIARARDGTSSCENPNSKTHPSIS
jgi:hypothetical protein